MSYINKEYLSIFGVLIMVEQILSFLAKVQDSIITLTSVFKSI